jgi:hypothetical protein
VTGRRAILSVAWGREKGLKAAILPGGRLRVGHNERADLVVPHDAKLSGAHFELSWDGERCHLRDLGSALGTELGGRRVDEGLVPHGGWIRAGETDFTVHVEGATPPPEPDRYAPDYEPEPPEAADRKRAAMEALRAAASEGPIYAVVDASRDERVLTLLREAVDESRSLYEGLAGEPLADVAPYVVRLADDSRLLGSLVEEGWGKRWAFYASTEAPMRELRRHLRRFLIVRNEETGTRMYFRYYDPGVLRVFLGAATPLQRSELFGPMLATWMEGPRGELLRFDAPSADDGRPS